MRVEVRELLREVDEAVRSVDLSPEADARVAERIEMERRRRARPSRPIGGVAIAFATGVALATGLALLWGRSTHDAGVPPTAVTYAPVDCSSHQQGDRLRLRGHCRIELSSAMVVETWRDAALAVTPRGPRVLDGAATFEVAPVRGDEPIRVLVAGGSIEVMGTRFTVIERDLRGRVDLVEGRIVFVDLSNRRVVLLPGERLTWTAAGIDALPSSPPAPTEPRIDSVVPAELDQPSPRPTPRITAESHRSTVPLDRIAQLRAAGRYEEALSVVRQTGRTKLDRRTREALAYEEGAILQDHLHRTDEACTHWRRHLRRFPSGTYAASVALRLRDCESQ